MNEKEIRKKAAREKPAPPKQEKKKLQKGPWENPKLLARVEQLIKNERMLKKHELISSACEEIASVVSKEFKEFLQEKGLKLTATSILKKLSEIVWTKDVDKALQGIVRMYQDPKDYFEPLYPYIPRVLVEKRVRWYRGVTRTIPRSEHAVPGIGRIRATEKLGDLSKFSLPDNSFVNPFEIPIKEKNGNWSVTFLNGANFGLRHGGNIVENVVRRALSDAEHHGDDAVILTNIISLDLKKAGGSLKIGRALAMGDNINPDIFADEEYREEARRILAEKPLDELVYQVAEELFDNVGFGWTKADVKPDDRLEYSRPIYIVLGVNEEELIKTVTDREIGYWTRLKQNMYEAQKRAIRSALTRATKDGDYELIEELQNRLAKVVELLARTVITNVANQEIQRFYEYTRAIIVRKIEQTIPNSKVINQGSTYISLGGETVEIHIPSHAKVTSALLKNYAGSYGPKNLREQLARAVVICSPHALNNRMTVREADYDGVRGDAHIFVAPIAVDEKYIRKVLKTKITPDHPIMKVVFSDQCRTGVMRLGRVNGVITSDFTPADALESFKKYRDKKKGNGKKNGHNSIPRLYGDRSKYIWVHTSTDQHFGGRAKEFVACKATGKRLGMAEATFHMMREAGLCTAERMPVHLFSTNDDEVQGQNFKARVEPHPHQRSFQDNERDYLNALARAKSTNSPSEKEKILEEAGRTLLIQMEKRGSDFLLEQMDQVFERHIDPNVDVFSAILGSAERIGLTLKGVGHYGNALQGGYDTRNVGVINFGSGNHFKNTVEGELVEGPFYARHLRERLSALPQWKDKKELLKTQVVAPLYGGQMTAWGTMKAGSGYEYGLDLRATPCRMSGWADPLFGAVSNDPLRGNYSRIFNGRLTLKTYGDKHFFGLVHTAYAIYHMCASGTHTDAYGEHGFPPNNTGVSFVGLPVDGPESGPILLRILTYANIKDFVETNPRPFDWERFLPNPA